MKSSLPVQDNRPLNFTIPKPALVHAKPGSAFGFRPPTSESTTEARMSDHRSVGGSMQPAEVVLNPESDFEQAARNEEHRNVTAMDLDQEAYGADSEGVGGVNLSANVNENIIRKPFHANITVELFSLQFDLGPDEPDLSDEEATKFLRPRRLFRRNIQVLSSGKF